MQIYASSVAKNTTSINDWNLSNYTRQSSNVCQADWDIKNLGAKMHWAHNRNKLSRLEKLNNNNSYMNKEWLPWELRILTFICTHACKNDNHFELTGDNPLNQSTDKLGLFALTTQSTNLHCLRYQHNHINITLWLAVRQVTVFGGHTPHYITYKIHKAKCQQKR